MKTILLIIAAVCSIAGLRAQTLEPLLDTTKRWTDISFSTAKDIYGGHTSTYKLSGLEEINGQDYFKLWVSEKDPEFQNWTLKGYIRETPDGKVYLKELNQTGEAFLYDFNLQPGDSLVYNEYGKIYADSVVFHEFAGKTRKFIYCHTFSYPETVRIVEGIGAIDYGFLYIQLVGAVGAIWNLLCFEQNGELLYHNEVNYGEGIIEDCFYDESGWPWDELISQTKKWTDVEIISGGDSVTYRSIKYKIGNNVFFEDVEYHELRKSTDVNSTEWETVGYLRMLFDNRLYFRKLGESTDLLLYYFTTYGSHTIDYGGNGVVITSYEMKEYAGRYRWYMYGTTFPESRPDTIIEGIGSITSGFMGVLNAGIENKNSHMLCFSQDENLLYHYPLQIPGYGLVEGCYVNYTDIDDLNPEKENNIFYPNPAGDEIYIQCEILPARVQLYDMQGSLCLTKHLIANRTVINLKGFEKGIYLVRIESKGKVVNLKLMK